MEEKNKQIFFKETLDIQIGYDENNNKVLNNYIFLDTIGKGSYSKVKHCVNKIDNKDYAVKIINKNCLMKKKKGYGRDKDGNMTIIYMLDDALNEIEILKRLNENGGHKNVIKLYEILRDEDKGKIYMILEFCSRGSIMNYNERSGVFSINNFYNKNNQTDAIYEEKDLKGFLRDMTEGLEFIHSKDIIHRDIKTDNILIDSDGNCKINDFNIASFIENEDIFTKTEGNLYFYPPEFCVDKSKIFQGKPVDVWAMGVTIYVAAYKRLPFMPTTPHNVMELFSLIAKADIKYPNTYSKDFKDFLQRLLERDANKRITAKEMISHKYLQLD